MKNKSGPKTPKGKLISSQNALKHGVTSKKLLSVDEHDYLSRLITEFTLEHDPQGETEKEIINDLAMIRIRLDRFDNAETALFTLAQANATAIETLEREMGVELGIHRDEFIQKLDSGEDFEHEALDSATQELHDYLSELKPNEAIPESIKSNIKSLIKIDCIKLHTDPDGLRKYITSNSSFAESVGLWKFGRPENEDDKKDGVSYLEEDLEKLKTYHLEGYIKGKYELHKFKCEKQLLLDKLKLQVEVMKNAALPEQAELDRIYKYRTTLERQFSSKLGQLIQLQEIKAKKARMKSIQN